MQKLVFQDALLKNTRSILGRPKIAARLSAILDFIPAVKIASETVFSKRSFQTNF